MIKFTYTLETDEEDDQMRGVKKKWTKFTYFLETDEEDGMRGLQSTS